MVTNIGQTALIISLIFSLILVLLPLYAKHEEYVKLAKPVVFIQWLSIALSFGSLAYLFLIDDLSVRYVAEASRLTDNSFLRFTAIWSTNDGALFLSSVMLSTWNLAVLFLDRKIPITSKIHISVILGVIIAALIFEIFSLYLFEIDSTIVDNRESNPLLEDLNLAIHPFLLYLGFTGLSVTYALSASFLINNQINISWINCLVPWVIAAWVFLASGLILGTWWTSYELGWEWKELFNLKNNGFLTYFLIPTLFLFSVLFAKESKIIKRLSLVLALSTFPLIFIDILIYHFGIFAIDQSQNNLLTIKFGALLLSVIVLFIIFSINNPKYFSKHKK